MRFTRTGPIAVIFVAEEGAQLAARIASALPEASLWAAREDLHADARVYEGTLNEHMGALWADHAAIVAVMATGIVVRSIAPWVASKYDDPAVVALDDAGRFAISLLSGHEGGANDLAEQLAELTGAVPVVTTGTEARRGVVLGVGSRRGVTCDAVLATIDESLAAAHRTRADVRAISTIDLKANEAGIREAADLLGVPVRIVSRERIRTLQDALREPTFAEQVTGVAAVCVPSALLADPHTRLLAPPTARQGVMVAVAEDDCPSSASVPDPLTT